jgi:hypothetical protein
MRDVRTKLDSRIRAFISHASAEEGALLEESRSAFIEVLQKAKERQLQHSPEKDVGSKKTLRDHIREGYTSLAEEVLDWAQVFDVIVGQAPEYVSLAYGAIKIIFVVEINYTTLKVTVREYMKQIKERFEAVDHLTAYKPTAHLVKAISQAYVLFSRFLEKAVKYYTQHRWGEPSTQALLGQRLIST